MSFLEIRKATKSFGSVEVLHEMDIDIEEGEFLVLVGPSGCGKSTLLNMIAGLEDFTSGEIRIKGKLMNGVHPSKRNIAMVFQSYALYPNMTVAQNITFGMEMHGVPKAERLAAMNRVAEMLQISALLDRKPSQLSGGQRQRVAMGRALVREPDVFLFDEPLSNLDAKLRVGMRTEIKKLHQAGHDRNLRDARSDRGNDAVNEDRGHESGVHAAVRNPWGDLQHPGECFRCQLHGITAHEFDPRQGRS